MIGYWHARIIQEASQATMNGLVHYDTGYAADMNPRLAYSVRSINTLLRKGLLKRVDDPRSSYGFYIKPTRLGLYEMHRRLAKYHRDCEKRYKTLGWNEATS